MAKAKRQTVEYFPHMVTHGKTIYVLEAQWGNDGYAFWFKLLELLGSADGHSYDCSNDSDWQYLRAKMGVPEEKARDILNLLASIGAIDRDLWEGREIVWSENFIDNLRELYSRRTVGLPTKPFCEGAESSAGIAKPNHEETEQHLRTFNLFWAMYPNKKGKKTAMAKWLKIKPGKEIFGAIMAGLEEYKKSDQWQRDNGQYIPHPATFLNQERWNDELQVKEKAWYDD